MKRWMSAVVLLSGLSLSAWDNLDFEQIPTPTETWTDTVPAWEHLGPNSGGGSYWNVNFANLAGWAEAHVVYLDAPDSPWLSWPSPPIDGRFSMAFSAAWPTLPISANSYDKASIRQTGTVEGLSTWLTLVTDYIGPHVEFYPGNTNYFKVGYLTLSFDGTPLAFRLTDAGAGPDGEPLRQLWAHLGAFSGQTGELRIGIEGPHRFAIDNIELRTILPGDLTGDGIVDMNDFVMAKKIAVGQRNPVGEELVAGDLNGNNAIDKEDAHLILGLIKEAKKNP